MWTVFTLDFSNFLRQADHGKHCVFYKVQINPNLYEYILIILNLTITLPNVSCTNYTQPNLSYITLPTNKT